MGREARDVGKEFEKYFSLSVPSDVMCLRLQDMRVPGIVMSPNPADYVLFDGELLMFIECKSVKGKSFPLARISDGQFRAMIKMCSHKNVHGGWLIDFREGPVFFLPLEVFITQQLNTEKKSMNITDLSKVAYKLNKTQMRKHYKYDIALLVAYMHKYHSMITEGNHEQSPDC